MYLLDDYRLQMDSDRRRDAFADMQLAFGSAMASDESGELSRMLADHGEQLLETGGYENAPPEKRKSKASLPLDSTGSPQTDSEMRRRLLAGESLDQI